MAQSPLTSGEDVRAPAHRPCSSPASGRRSRSAQLLDAARRVGCFRVTGHGVPRALQADMEAAARALHELPAVRVPRHLPRLTPRRRRRVLGAPPGTRETITAGGPLAWPPAGEEGSSARRRRPSACRCTRTPASSPCSRRTTASAASRWPTRTPACSSPWTRRSPDGTLLVNVGDIATARSNAALHSARQRVRCVAAPAPAPRFSVGMFLLWRPGTASCAPRRRSWTRGGSGRSATTSTGGFDSPLCGLIAGEALARFVVS
ncbi:hypothetical protein ACP4OV_006009 [Aristida adscensionis]